MPNTTRLREQVAAGVEEFIDDAIETMAGRLLDANRDHGDETGNTPSPARSTYSIDQLIPVSTTMATLEVLTDSQRERLLTLIESWRAGYASVSRDDFDTSNLCFSLWTRDPQAPGTKHLLSGLIEPDGRSHT